MLNKKSVQSPETPENYWCKLISKNEAAENAFVAKDCFTIGRAPNNDLQIANIKVSGLHCTLVKTPSVPDPDFLIEDNSSNGTYLNGKKLGKGIRANLKNGDEVVLLNHDTGYITIHL
eukprot:TRINITY_DN6535_c0_g1_i12.p2 TRINITY_DN6535_c0_g1~~TRINITY_DN6535_c0_g1_i12.p2  ORF type:complete len:118 (+),score=21.31 TRINITY_DN6535_c0_g1_i12:100-453(+)